MKPIEALAQSPSGDPVRDRRAFERIMAQAADEGRPGPASLEYGFAEWWDRFGERLMLDWPKSIHPHPAWVTILIAAIDQGPQEFGAWPEEDWTEALEKVMAVWLWRDPDSMLLVLRDIVRPYRHPVLAFIVVHEYLKYGPYPLTPEIVKLLEETVSQVSAYSDEAAEWLVHALHQANALDLMRKTAENLTAAQSQALQALGDYGKSSEGFRKD